MRYDGDLRSLGLPKTEAVRVRLTHLNPFIKVTTANVQFGSDSSVGEARAVLDDILGADLTIESTGLHQVRRYLNEVAYAEGQPSLYAWVTTGVWGGEVVRVIPGETPCYLCFRDNHHLEAPAEPSALTFAPGCAQPTFTGTGFDSSEVASQATRAAVQTLLRGTGAYPDMSGHHLVLSLRGADGLFSPQIQLESFTRTPDCYVCSVSR